MESNNFVLIVKYACGESGYLTNTPDLIEALKEYDEKRKAQMGWGESKHVILPEIKEAKIYRVFK